MDGDDKKRRRLSLCQRHRASIISQLVDIGSKQNQQKHVKLLSFVRDLQCLRPEGSELHRESINACRQRQYVALSYTWTPSKYEDPKPGRHTVKNWDDEHFTPSRVRECVLDRALHYMRYTGVRLLWIDAHCIRQDTDDVDNCARHLPSVEKRNAIQTMDLVYQLSEHPVALLGRPLKNRHELYLLTRILSGNLVGGNCESLSSVACARKALSLISMITRDYWWRRAWTFQENYRGGVQMRLLIHHDPSLEPLKQRRGVFGKIPGEVCISSVKFSTQATRLCLAFRSAGRLRRRDKQLIHRVLQAAGRYKLILDCSRPMTPRVIADIEARGLSELWDRLAIVANCCQYPVRLNYEALKKQGRSLSLSMLAMCLLNGEILDNGNVDMASVAELTAAEILNKQMFRNFEAPAGDRRRLTFYKGCRLSYVELTAGGIETKGHLWKLGRIIDTAKFSQRLPWIREPSGRLTLFQRKRLLQLVRYLQQLGHRPLARWIDKYLKNDACAVGEYTSFTDMYLHHMAAELAAVIKQGLKLRLASIWDGSRRLAEYRAVFVWSDQGSSVRQPLPDFAFTSTRQGDPGSWKLDANDIDRHVSLLVDKELPGGGGKPHLYVRSWLLGMCFFNGYQRTKVVFPWPRGLQGISP